MSQPIPLVPGFEHFTVDTGDLQPHVAIVGEGEPVVMLHGFPEHWWQWAGPGKWKVTGHRELPVATSPDSSI